MQIIKLTALSRMLHPDRLPGPAGLCPEPAVVVVGDAVGPADGAVSEGRAGGGRVRALTA